MADQRAIVFDLDDTLYPERQFAFSGFTAVAETFAHRLGDVQTAVVEMGRLFDTQHRSRVFNELLVKLGQPADGEFITRMIAAYREHKPTIALFPGVPPVLEHLRDGYKLGLITDGPAQQQRNKIDALGLTRRFDEIIVTGELGAGLSKPHPRAFELIAERLGVEACRCTYVADNAAKDFVAPNALGWRTVRVRRDDGIYQSAPAPDGGEPQHTIGDLDQLIDRLSASEAGR